VFHFVHHSSQIVCFGVERNSVGFNLCKIQLI
jgi:hypothetical protein